MPYSSVNGVRFLISQRVCNNMTPRGIPLAPALLSSFFYYTPRDCVYVNNAKAACSTIKATMMRAILINRKMLAPPEFSEQEVHGRHEYWNTNLHDIAAGRTRIFTVVRNPYARVLSAYLDKICKPGILRAQFCLQHGFALDAEIGFSTFLRTLDESDGFFVCDQHWRPQVENVYLGSLGPMRIHYLENFAQTLPDLMSFLDWEMALVDWKNHATGATNKVAEIYDAETVALVQKLYRDDFEAFGYSTDPADAHEAPADWMTCEEYDADARRTLDLASMARAKEDAGAFRARLKQGDPSFVDRAITCAVFEWAAKSVKPGPNADAAPDTASGTGRCIPFTKADLLAEARTLRHSSDPITRLVANDYLSARALRIGNTGAAIASLRELVGLAPYFVSYRYQLALVLIEAGKRRKAQQVLVELAATTWQTKLVEKVEAGLAGMA